MRFAYYAINGIGLGHLARTVAIAKALDAHADGKGHDHLFLTSSPATDILQREGFPFVGFPSDTLISNKTLPLKDKTYSRVLANLVTTTLNSFVPHVFVVDTVPHGVRNELAIVTAAARRSAFVLRARGAIDPATVAAINGYDLVLMPHEGAEVPAGIDAAKVRQTGAVVLGSGESMGRDEARAALGLERSDKPLVGVAFGGGGDQRCGELLAWAASAADRFPDLNFVVSLPPLMSGDVDLGERVSTITRSPLADVWGAFDFAISAAGYNSTHELLHAGVPTIFVPLVRPLDDQFARAAHFVGRGAAISATAFDNASLDRAVASLSNAEARAAMASEAMAAGAGEGASRAADHLLELAR